MKRMMWMVAGVLMLAACNKETGPEYKTGATFGEISVSKNIEAGLPVRVSVPIECEYGLSRVSIFYSEEDTPDEVKEAGARLLTPDITSLVYEGSIPKSAQKAGKKVTFRVYALTAYNVPSYSVVQEYTVPDSDDGSVIKPDPVE